MNERILKINEELRKLQDSLDGTLSQEQLVEIRSKKDKLIAERSRLIAEEQEALKRSFDNGSEVTQTYLPKEEGNPFKGLNNRNSLCLALGMIARGKDVSKFLNERELGQSTITSSETFIPATESTNGESNAGIFINTEKLFDLLYEKEVISGIAADIAWKHIPGMVEFPYRKKVDKKDKVPSGKAENKAISKKQSYEWDKLTLVKGWLQSEAEVIDEVLALTDFKLGEYILDILVQDFKEGMSIELIYSDGTKDSKNTPHISGLTAELTPKTYTDSYEKALVTAITSLPTLYRTGAKLYVAQDVYDGISFATDANGNFKYPVVNSLTGIQTFGKAKVEVDPMLDDGEIIAGNVNQYFLGNILIDLNTEADRDKRNKTNAYITSMYCATKAVKEAFIYMKKGK